MSQAEADVAFYLTEASIAWEHNTPIGRYCVDFLLPKNIIIECDPVVCKGKYHSHCKHTEKKDKRRETYLKKSGYRIIRWDDSDLKSIHFLVEQLLADNPELKNTSAKEITPIYFSMSGAAKFLEIGGEKLKRILLKEYPEHINQLKTWGKAYQIEARIIEKLKNNLGQIKKDRFDSEQYNLSIDLAKELNVTANTVSIWCRLGILPNGKRVSINNTTYWAIPKSIYEKVLEIPNIKSTYIKRPLIEKYILNR